MIYLFDYATLKLIWWLLVGALLVGFAILDGFDLGVGTLLPFVARTDIERRVALNSVGPTWEGNQVWFITAGGATFAAWPLVYATAFSGFYVALILTLFALFFRPVGFDYRSKVEDPRWRRFWDWGIFAGGTVPALVFGVAFGNLLQGVPFHFDAEQRVFYTGSFVEMLNPFGLLAGVVSVAMLAMHGASFLVLRTEGALQERARRAGRIAALIFVVAFAAGGVFIATSVEGYRITAMPPENASFIPLAKTVVRAHGAWLDNYSLHPWTLLGAAGGLRRRTALAARGSAAARWPRVRAVLGVRGRSRPHRGVRALSVHHAVIERSGEQPNSVGRGVEPAHAAGDVLRNRLLPSDHPRLHGVGVPRDARQGDRAAREGRQPWSLLNSDGSIDACGTSRGSSVSASRSRSASST